MVVRFEIPDWLGIQLSRRSPNALNGNSIRSMIPLMNYSSSKNGQTIIWFFFLKTQSTIVRKAKGFGFNLLLDFLLWKF